MRLEDQQGEQKRGQKSWVFLFVCVIIHIDKVRHKYYNACSCRGPQGRFYVIFGGTRSVIFYFSMFLLNKHVARPRMHYWMHTVVTHFLMRGVMGCSDDLTFQTARMPFLYYNSTTFHSLHALPILRERHDIFWTGIFEGHLVTNT